MAASVKLGVGLFLTGAVITKRGRFIIINRCNYYILGQLLHIDAQQCELKSKLLFKSFGKLSNKNSAMGFPCCKTLSL